MPLKKTLVGFPFAKGINQKPSEKSQAAGELTDCVNFRMDKTGRLDRRLGFDRLSNTTVAVGHTSGGSVSSAKAMAHLGDEVLLFDGEEVFSKATDDNWVKQGDVLNVRSETKFVNRDSQSTSGTMSYAVSGDFEYLAWAEQPYHSGGNGADIGGAAPGNMARYKYMVRDRHTGATIVPARYLPGPMVMDTRIVTSANVTGVAGPPSGNGDTLIGTGFDGQIAVGNYIHFASDAGSEPTKHLVDSVANTISLLTTEFTINHGATPVNPVLTVYKDTGNDSLFWAPRIRVIAIPGTSRVYLLAQYKNEIRYFYATTSSGTAVDLEFIYGQTLDTIVGIGGTTGSFPAWDADWLLTSDTTFSGYGALNNTDGAAIVLFSTGGLYAYLHLFMVDSGGSLVAARTHSPQATRFSTPHLFDRGISAGENPSQINRIAQPFVKVLHSTDSDGVPTKTRNSRILIGYNSADYDTVQGYINRHPQLYCYEDTLNGTQWGSKLYTSAGVGVAEDLCLARAGVGYDGTSTYVMAEMHDGATPPLHQPQKTEIVYTKITVSTGVRVEETRLWSNVSIQSDGFIPPGSATSKCYWWLSAAQPTSTVESKNTYATPTDLSLNSITFMGDQSGTIHGHGVKGNSGLNTLLEYRSMEQGAEEGPSRNMQGLASRVTEGRWETSGSTEFWCGGAMADIGAAYGVHTHFQPALLKWDTDPYRPFRSESAHGVLYTTGGLLWSYDGNRFVENDFLLSPVVTQTAHVGTGTADAYLNAGVYGYYITYEFQDDEGVRHVSAPAGPYEVTSASDPTPTGTDPVVHDRAQLDIAFSHLTNHRFSGKAGNPATYSVNVYRTNVGGSVHYLHETLGTDEWGDSFNPEEQVISYFDVDNTQHSDLSETLVWDDVPAQLAGNPVSSPVDITRHKDSLMVSNTENILYSSLGLVSGQAAIFPGVVAENAGAYALYGDSFESPITHIASNGPSFLFFSKDSVYGLDGEGPTSTGGGTWSRPIKISQGQGVRSDGFVAETPLGVLYSSQSGIYLVGRDLQIGNVGAAVDDYARYSAANDPLVLDSTNEVIIPLWGGDPTDISSAVNRTALVFNYFHKQWYRMELPSSVETGRNVEWRSWVDASDNVALYLCDSAGHLFKYKSASSLLPYADTVSSSSAVSVSSNAETSWLQFPGYGGKMRVYKILMMGTFDPASDGTTTLALSSSTNFNGTAVDETFTSVITAAGIGSETQQGSSQVVAKPSQQKSESLRVSFTMTSGPAGKGWSPEGLLFEVGERPSETRFKVGSDKQAS